MSTTAFALSLDIFGICVSMGCSLDKNAYPLCLIQIQRTSLGFVHWWYTLCQVRFHSFVRNDIRLNSKTSGMKFDHKSKSWLVLWEAGVVIELPPWVVFLYPSSLLYHFNVDVEGKPPKLEAKNLLNLFPSTDFKFVLTDGERPTPENCRPLGGSGDEGRGSLVYFNQATMYHGPETSYNTLSALAARKAGHSGIVSSAEKASSAFTEHFYAGATQGGAAGTRECKDSR
jgi:hypothetical protein